VVLTAHPSKSGLETGAGISGSTAWHNSVRSRLYLTRPKQIDETAEPMATERILRTMMSNYGPGSSDIALTWREGVFVAAEEPTGMVRAINARNAERIFLECLDAATQQKRAFSEHKTAANYAPKAMARMRQAGGTDMRKLEQAMERLFGDGRISVGTPFVKPNRHPASGIVRNELEGIQA